MIFEYVKCGNAWVQNERLESANAATRLANKGNRLNVRATEADEFWWNLSQRSIHSEEDEAAGQEPFDTRWIIWQRRQLRKPRKAFQCRGDGFTAQPRIHLIKEV